MARIIRFPDGKSENQETDRAWAEQSEAFQASLMRAIGCSNSQPYIDECKELWETEGNILKQLRVARGLLVSHIAEGLGVSPGRIKRLEAGEPVNDAMLLKKSYLLFVTHPSVLQVMGVTSAK